MQRIIVFVCDLIYKYIYLCVDVDVFVYAFHTGTIISGATPAELVSEYSLFTGRMPVLPSWSTTGPIVGIPSTF